MWYEISLMFERHKNTGPSDNTIIEKRSYVDEYLWMKPFDAFALYSFRNDAN